MGKNGLTIFLVIFIVFLSLLDIGLNLLSFIPYFGSALETASETIIELLQIFLVIILAFIGGKR